MGFNRKPARQAHISSVVCSLETCVNLIEYSVRASYLKASYKGEKEAFTNILTIDLPIGARGARNLLKIDQNCLVIVPEEDACSLSSDYNYFMHILPN